MLEDEPALNEMERANTNEPPVERIGEQARELDTSAVQTSQAGPDDFWQQLRDSKKERPMPAATPAVPTEAIPGWSIEEYGKVIRQFWHHTGWFGLLGILNLFSGNVPGGIAFLGIALIAYLLPSVTLLAVYGIFFLWTAILNVFVVGDGSQYLWALVLLVSGLVELRNFFRHRQSEEKYFQARADDPFHVRRTMRILPWLSLISGLSGLAGWLTMWVVLFIWSAFNPSTAGVTPAFIAVLLWLSAHISVLGLAMGIAALIARYPNKVQSAVGIATGGLVMLMAFAFQLIF